MLKKSDIQNSPDAIEKMIVIPMSKLNKHQMDKGLTQMLAVLLLTTSETLELMYKDLMQHSSIPEAINKRNQAIFPHGAIFDKKLLALLTFVSDGRIGLAIMYMYYLQWYAFTNNLLELTINDVCRDIFPTGFFDPTDLSRIWQSTKVQDKFAIHNLIDYGECARSFMRTPDVHIITDDTE